MKNKVILAMAAAAGLGIAGYAMNTQAMTTARESEDGTVEYRVFTGNAAESYEEWESTDQVSAKDDENFRKQEIKDNLAFLKEYGVTYDVEKDAIYYGKDKVRWLIDGKPLGNCTDSYYTQGGTIDVYTVRDKDGAITGVRKATEEEFNQRDEQKLTGVITGTFKTAEEDYAENAEDFTGLVIGNASETVVESSIDSEASGDQKSSANQESSANQGSSAAQESSADTESESLAEYRIKIKNREEEYAKVGIGQDEDGCWTWKGKKVYLLLDDDGGMAVFGNERAKKDRIYLYISRDEDGNIVKVEAVSAAELLEKKALQDTEGDEG